MTPTAIIADAIMLGALVLIGALEVRKRRRRARGPHWRSRAHGIEWERRLAGWSVIALSLVAGIALPVAS